MASPEIATSDAARIRSAINVFLQERLQPKLDKLKEGDDELRQKLIAEHQPAAWIADAARRVGQIQQVTHAIKFTHSSAGSSNWFSTGNPAADARELGSHALEGQLSPDVVGNAAALDVYKFLCLTIDGRSLLDRATTRDPALAEALTNDAAKAAEWLVAFSSLPETKGRLSSHTLAKQLYWPVGEGAYHLLAPLFSSSLAHAVHKRIGEDRFSDAAKAAREAERADKAHPHGYRDYPNLAIQNFGGSKPQNISQLNSERRGENYLLAAIPPVWKSPALRPPLKTETVFSHFFGRRKEVRRLVGVLKEFLRRMANDRNKNINVRETREELVAELCGEALNMAAELRNFMEPGWSAQADCQLNLAEQCWLDPARGLSDEDFATLYRRGDWQIEVSRSFGNWLNASLKTDKTIFGSAEALEWQTMLERELHKELGDE